MITGHLGLGSDPPKRVRLGKGPHSLVSDNRASRTRFGFAKMGRARNGVPQEHFYRVEIFLVTIDKQLQESNHRFNEEVVELLTLSSYSVPKNSYKAFNIQNICSLAGNITLWIS